MVDRASSGSSDTRLARYLYSRRAALGLLGASAAAFVAFGPRGRSADQGHGRLVLDYWEKWTGHEGQAMQEVVDAFNASQNRIFVRYFVTGNIGQKALIAIAGGTPPDVIGLWSFNVPAYAESGAIMPLVTLASGAGLKLDHYRRGLHAVMVHQNRWFAVVNTAGTLAMFYNKTRFREAGLDPNRPPATIEELVEYQKKLTDMNGQSIVRTGHLHAEPGWWSWLWANHFGSPLYDPATNTARVDTPANRAAYAWLQNTVRAFGANDQAAVQAVELFRQGLGNYNTPQNAFLTGKVAMVIQGPWLANMIVAFNKELDYGVAPFPVSANVYNAAEPIAGVDTDVLVVPRGAKNPEASMEFIAFTQRQDMTEKLAKAHCKICPLVHATDDFLRTHANRGLAAHNALADSPRAFVPPKTRAWPEIKDDYDATVQKMWRLEVPADEALAALQIRAQGYIDRTTDQNRRRYGEKGNAIG